MLEDELDELLANAGTAVGESVGIASNNEADSIDRATQGICLDHIHRIRRREVFEKAVGYETQRTTDNELEILEKDSNRRQWIQTGQIGQAQRDS